MSHLIQNKALALTSSATNRDNSDGLFDELKDRNGLWIHLELPLLIAVYEADRPRRTGG